MNTDVAIIGAGPGGCTAALFLAGQNIPSVLIDKCSFPRDKVCGDALSGKVVGILNELDPDMLAEFSSAPYQRPSGGIIFKTPGNHSLKIPFKKVYSNLIGSPGYTSKRIDFDYFLFNKACQKDNIRILDNREIVRVENENSKIRLFDSQGILKVEAKLIILASGATTSLLNNFRDPVKAREVAVGVRTYFSGVDGLDPGNYVELHFLKNLVPGYFWIFPLPENKANAGIVLRSDLLKKKKVKLKNTFADIIQTDKNISPRFKNARQEGVTKGYSLPLASGQRNLSGERFMLVGDAGALIDPFTGEGIGNAMISGKLAAMQTIECLKSNDFSRKTMKNYDQNVYRELGKEFKISNSLQKLVRFPFIFDFLAWKASKNQRLRAFISTMFEDMDAREKLKKPGFYLKMLLNI